MSENTKTRRSSRSLYNSSLYYSLETSLQRIVLLISQIERDNESKLIYLGSLRTMKAGMIGFI